MLALINEKRPVLAELCVRYHVRRLAVFGSATGTDFDPSRSDLDMAVEFEPLDPHQHRVSYFGLLDDLERLFARRIDLVEYAPIRNPYFLRSLRASQVVLYDAA